MSLFLCRRVNHRNKTVQTDNESRRTRERNLHYQ